MNVNHPDANRNEGALSSRKEIGAYLERNEATARRWEKEEGLPVHRHSHKRRSSVYAYPSEIDAWRRNRRVVVDPPPVNPWYRPLAIGVTTLACLILVSSERPASAQQLAPKLVCTQCGDYEAYISPDGHWLAFTDYNTGDIVIRDLQKGQTRRLMAKIGSYKDSPDFAEEPVLSPDLRWVAYIWDTGGQKSLRVTANQPGGKSRVVREPDSEYDMYVPVSWSADGKSILVFASKLDKTELAWISAADGSMKTIKSLGWRGRGIRSTDAKVSPDGRYIAYAARATNPSQLPPGGSDCQECHIYVLAADGSSETEVAKTASENVSPLWTPDGKRLLFLSDRTGTMALWWVPVENGNAVGAESLLNSNLGVGWVWPIAVTRDGSYHYVLDRGSVEQISVVPIHSDGRKAQGKTEPVASLVGMRAAWSPDGRSLGLKRHHPGSSSMYDLVVHSLDTGNERTFPTSLGSTGPGAPAWLRDGKALVTGLGGSQPAISGFYRIDLGSGEWTKFAPTGGILSPDEKTMYALRPGAIVAIDGATGAERKILAGDPQQRWYSFALSPDGRTLAVCRNDPQAQKMYLATVGVDGSNFHELYTPPYEGPGPRAAQVAWTADGQTILFDRPRGDESKTPASRTEKRRQIMRISAQGGTPESTGIETDGIVLGLAVSPDGSRLAYTAYSSARMDEELWSLRGVVAAVK
jgi:Tol biopolymer transport system component